MSNEGWAPKPRRDFNLNGLFSYEDRETTIEKSNRWQQQRELDGTPHTTPGPTAWSPPLAGPKLVLNEFEDAKKAIAAEMKPHNEDTEKGLDPEVVLKSYFKVVDALVKGDAEGAISEAQGVANEKIRGVSEEKSLNADDDDEDEIEKTK